MKLAVAVALALVASIYAESCKDQTDVCPNYKKYCKVSARVRHICPLTCEQCGGPTYPPPVPGTLPPMDQCGVPQIQKSRVVGGTNATRGAWPWQVLMMTNMRPGCGGTLISPRWVVTAAHCVDRSVNRPNLFKIRVGENDWYNREGSEDDIDVERVIAHPKWNTRNLDYDIALFKLARPAVFGKYVQPACLPSKTLPPGTKCMLTGWGKIKHPGGMHHFLQQAVMPIVDDKVCEAKNKKAIGIPITSRMICAGEGGVNPISGCHGDSGGPFVCEVNGRWELHGDVSHGSPRCKSTETYTVFARTTFFKDWILDNMKKYGGN